MRIADVTIIDYGVGNLLSVQRGLERSGVSVHVSSLPEEIREASRLVLPGVGAFSSAMESLRARSLVEPIQQAALGGTPLLGICLGMQLLFEESCEFGLTKGLGLIPGAVLPLPRHSVTGERLKSPNIGWRNLIAPIGSPSWEGTILESLQVGDSVYFLHSFAASPSEVAHLLAESLYGGHRVTSVVVHKNIVGCQFHPEKSGQIGLKILARFLNLSNLGLQG